MRLEKRVVAPCLARLDRLRLPRICALQNVSLYLTTPACSTQRLDLSKKSSSDASDQDNAGNVHERLFGMHGERLVKKEIKREVRYTVKCTLLWSYQSLLLPSRRPLFLCSNPSPLVVDPVISGLDLFEDRSSQEGRGVCVRGGGAGGRRLLTEKPFVIATRRAY